MVWLLAYIIIADNSSRIKTECKGADGAKVFFFIIFCLTFGFVMSFFPLPSTSTISSLLFYLNAVAMLGQYLKSLKLKWRFYFV